MNWGIKSVYYGSLFDWIIPSRRGRTKKRNFDLIYQIDKEKIVDHPQNKLSYVLIGDVGEYDEEAYKLIIDEYPESIKAIFLHVVGHPIEQINYIDHFYRNIPIIYFHTYFSASMKAYKYQLMNLQEVVNVFNSTFESIFSNIHSTSSSSSSLSDNILDIKPIDQVSRIKLFSKHINYWNKNRKLKLFRNIGK